MANTNVAPRRSEQEVSDPTKQLKTDLQAMAPQFELVLPSHIKLKTFLRCGVTAFNNNPDLAKCDRRLLWNCFMESAQIGVPPDGKRAQIVVYGGRPTFIVMVEGMRELATNSGLIADWNVQCVQSGDEFDFQLGDQPYIHHRPAMTGGRTRPVIAAYSICRFKDGTVSREVMNVDQIEDIRKKSRAQKGPWSDPVYYPEMCRKTVARLHSKQLPLSAELRNLIRREDAELGYDDRPTRLQVTPPGSARALLEQFGSGGNGKDEDDDGDNDRRDDPPSGDPREEPPPPPPPPPEQAPPPPQNAEQYRVFAERVIDAAEDGTALQAWWNSSAQRRMRNSCAVTKDRYDALFARIHTRLEALETTQ